MDFNSLYKKLKIKKDLVTNFSIFFSRFEYSLKKTGYVIKLGNNVEPNWAGFASKHNSEFNPKMKKSLKKAVNFLISNPPKKQIIADDGVLDFEKVNIDENTPLLIKIIDSIRRVRNNLFHGGKFSVKVDDPSRNKVLLESCIIILEECLTLDQKINRIFFEDK